MKSTSATSAEVEAEPLYSVDNFRPEDSLPLLIGMVRSRLTAACDENLADLGLTGAQLPVLHWISNTPGATAATLCRCLGTDTGSMTRMLNRLEAKGFIRRVRSQTDRRVVFLEVTAAGKALKPMITQRMVEIMNRFLIGFQRQDLEQLKSLLQQMLKNA